MNAHELFDPARLPERDEYGCVEHPDMSIVLNGLDPDRPIPRERFSELGLHAVQIWGEGETGDGFDEELYQDHPAKALKAWRPRIDDRWRLAWIIETEDGPVALFVRPKVAL